MLQRILIIGLGSAGKKHLRLARKLLPFSEIKILRHQETGEIPEFSDGYVGTIEDAIEYARRRSRPPGPAPGTTTLINWPGKKVNGSEDSSFISNTSAVSCLRERSLASTTIGLTFSLVVSMHRF